METAAQDAAELAGQLARGEGRLFRVGLYVTVRAPSEEALEREVHRVRAVCASLLLDTRPVTRAVQGWLTLPLGIDALRLRRTFDTKALAAAFPFASAELESSGGIFLGRNATTGGLVFVDGSPSRTTTRSSSPARAPARATSPSSRSFDRSTRASRCSSSTPRTSTDASRRPSAASWSSSAPPERLNPLDLARREARGAHRPGPVRPHSSRACSARSPPRRRHCWTARSSPRTSGAGIRRPSNPRSACAGAGDVVTRLRDEPGGPRSPIDSSRTSRLSPRALRSGDRPRGGAPRRLLAQDLPRS